MLDYKSAAPDMSQANLLRAQDEQRKLALMGKLGAGVGQGLQAFQQSRQKSQSQDNLNELFDIAYGGQGQSTVPQNGGWVSTEAGPPIQQADDAALLKNAGFDSEEKQTEFIEEVAPLVDLPPEQAAQALEQRAAKVSARGGNPEDSIALAQGMRTNPAQARQQITTISQLMQNERARELIARDPSMLNTLQATGLQGLGIGKRSAVKGVEGEFTFKDENGNIFSQQTFMDPNTETSTGVLTDVSGRGLQPVGKLTPVQKSGESKAESRVLDSKQAVKDAREKAMNSVVGADMGDDIVKEKFLEANMPNIESTVSKLNELNEIATYTTGGKIVDSAFRQLGFEVPKGATARAQATAIVNSTILPLLKPTFGSAFTEREGDKLVAVWGDPDASPTEKKMALEGMMMAVRLEHETVKRKLGKKINKKNKPASAPASDNAASNLKALEVELGL
jgi:hypothetical protein